MYDVYVVQKIFTSTSIYTIHKNVYQITECPSLFKIQIYSLSSVHLYRVDKCYDFDHKYK